ncbi:MAG: methionine synthase [Candidatus Thorarchaeota archaeon]
MIKKVINDKINKNNEILTASIGQCIHIAGIYNFMQIAKNLGYKCNFLGPAISISKILIKIEEICPNIVGLSYRLTPETVLPLFKQFFREYKQLKSKPERLFFAGTPEVVEIAKQYDEFDEFFIGGESKFKIISILREEKQEFVPYSKIPMNLLSRIRWKKPYPIIRAHFGLPNLETTIEGIKKIASANILDVISIAPDQNTQSNYFYPENQIEELSGAGGVPLRSKEDFLKLHQARLTGNYPMLRIYAGTRDFIKLGKIFNKTIQNAWAAIPIFWFNQMDGRGPLSLKESIKKHIQAIRWHAKKEIPVEINDSHHWSLRDAPDAIAVADMYLCGKIAKNLGVKNFIAQYMFNTPPSSSFEMDLAKILAKDELLHTLTDENFSIIRQVRTGLASFPLDLDRAKGQLAAATMIQLIMKPDIVHVVSYSEADHAASPNDIIESCKIVDQVINKVYASNLKITDEKINQRKNELIKQAKWIFDIIPFLAKNNKEFKNPYTNYKVLNRIVKFGIFDAPHLKNNKFALGKIRTKIIDGACYSWDELQQKKCNEIQRIIDLILNIKNIKLPESLLEQGGSISKVISL